MEAEQPAELIALQPTLEGMREKIDECRGCDLYRNATQGVFGEGSAAAKILFVGEQPGDEEDRKGAPFVGPARRRSALAGLGWPLRSRRFNRGAGLPWRNGGTGSVGRLLPAHATPG